MIRDKRRKRKIYGLYDKDNDQLVTTGSMDVLAKYCNRKVQSMYRARTYGTVIAKKYKVYYLGFSEYVFAEMKKCTRCGKEKPLEDFEFVANRNVYRSICRLCRRKIE